MDNCPLHNIQKKNDIGLMHFVCQTRHWAAMIFEDWEQTNYRISWMRNVPYASNMTSMLIMYKQQIVARKQIRTAFKRTKTICQSVMSLSSTRRLSLLTARLSARESRLQPQLTFQGRPKWLASWLNTSGQLSAMIY